ncbi:NRDE family protein [Polaribacter undariae]|uniref:NRDE family protein n=1 Tax=Polaribacter sejongensis TaxID=985043 RepID=A0AAJ1QYL3_9FLAO|nr:NRDE family protein [Polaribacter undariae]MDN3620485.1 NRDE family protein [Polaribacter undariae]UWD31310.1 NRDE family protein [Polaribacter undariae]
MCTVSYLPLGNNDFILTSNRDETPLRNTIPPQNYIENGVQLTYPKDELAGGTWIGLSDKSRLVCLLNGGFKIHARKSSYKISRGIIVKNILSADDGVAYVNNYDFTDIEPFTLILVDWKNQLETYELVWDGNTKHFNKLTQEPKIWSSSTLYTEEMKEMRQVWFSSWLLENDEFQQEKILGFHQNENLGNAETSPKMKRNTVETVSVTSVKKEKSKVNITYLDVLNPLKSKIL